MLDAMARLAATETNGGPLKPIIIHETAAAPIVKTHIEIPLPAESATPLIRGKAALRGGRLI